MFWTGYWIEFIFCKYKLKKTPSWFEDEQSDVRDSKAVGKMVELETQYKNEQKRVK